MRTTSASMSRFVMSFSRSFWNLYLKMLFRKYFKPLDHLPESKNFPGNNNPTKYATVAGKGDAKQSKIPTGFGFMGQKASDEISWKRPCLSLIVLACLWLSSQYVTALNTLSWRAASNEHLACEAHACFESGVDRKISANSWLVNWAWKLPLLEIQEKRDRCSWPKAQPPDS